MFDSSQSLFNVIAATSTAQISPGSTLTLISSDNTANISLDSASKEIDITVPSPIGITGTTGTDATLVMSQDAVTKELLSKADYIEGKWAPVLSAAIGTTDNNTYGTRYGTYTKIGNMVFYNLSLAMYAIDPTLSGNITISGLPYTSIDHITAASIAYTQGVTIASPNTQLLAYSKKGGISFYQAGAPEVQSKYLAIEDISDLFSVIVSGSFLTKDPV